MALLERNNKNIQENLDQLERDYDKVAHIVEGAEVYADNADFQNFLDGLEKKNDLEVTKYLIAIS